MLIVDAANVVGSRPDGWWRDRAGAADRLIGLIRRAVAAERLPVPVVVVLEGKARDAAEQGLAGRVEVVRAAGGGDDTIVELATRSAAPVVVTADRGLQSRARSVGAQVWRPGRLLEVLEGV